MCMSNGFMAGVKAGLTPRGAAGAAGITQVPRAAAMGGGMSVMNRAHGILGVHPVTAMALGNGALRVSMMKTPSTSVMRHSIEDQIHSRAYAASAHVFGANGTAATPVATPVRSGVIGP